MFRVVANERLRGRKQTKIIQKVCGVKFGDVYAMIVEHYSSQGKYQQAYDAIEKMKKNSHTDLLAYLDKKVVLHIYQMTKHKIDFPLDEEENSEFVPEDINQ